MELLTPDLFCDKVEDITPALLESLGIRALLIDIDNTLVSRASGSFEDSVLVWIAQMKRAGVSLCLLSNNWHAAVYDYAAELDLPIVAKAIKPLPLFYIKALALIGAQRATTAMVGDQLFTDILGARLCVLFSILVKPLSTTDLWYTQFFRVLEQRIRR